MSSELTPTMDILVAQHVMGWKYEGYCRRGPIYLDENRRDWELGFTFSPSQIVDHAMLVVEHLANRYGVCKFDLFWEKMPPLLWRGHVLQTRATTTPGALCQYRNLYAEGKTPALAICLVSLEAVRDLEGEVARTDWRVGDVKDQ